MTDALPKVPRFLGQGLFWVLGATAFFTWSGWLQPPGLNAERQEAAYERTQEKTDGRVTTLEQAIAVLEAHRSITASELNRMNNKLDEMAMVLYSLERRTP